MAGGASGGGSTAGGSAPCSPACPAGFTCVAGACSGGPLSNVALNIATSPLTLDLRANASPLPMTCGFDNIIGRIDVFDPQAAGTALDTFGTPYFRSCTSPLTAMGRVEDGTTLGTRLSGNGLFNGSANFVRGPDTLVSGPTTRTIDVTLIPVSGRILANGQPVSCSAPLPGAELGTLVFINTGVEIRVPVTCTQGRYGFTAQLPIRTYRVYFAGLAAHPSLPDTVPALVATNAQVASPTSTLDFNTTAAPVTFTLRQNGAPVPCPAQNGGLGYGFLTDGLSLIGTGTNCVPGVGYRVTHRVMPGRYEFALSNSNGALLPTTYDLRLPVSVTATDTSVAIDLTTVEVSGTITVNGAPLTNCAANDSVYAYDPATSVQHQLPIVCGATTTFRGRVPVGVYEFFIDSNANEIPPGQTWVQTLQAASTISFALTTRTVSFSVTANGMSPQSTCTGTDAKVTFTLQATQAGGSTGSVSINCAAPGFSRSAVVFQGVSTVSVGSSKSTLPYIDTGHPLDTRTASAFALDIPVRSVAGTLTVNGAAAGCVSGSTATYGDLFTRGGASEVRTSLQCVQGNWTFTAWGRPGTWELRTRGQGGGLPDVNFARLPALVVP